MTYKLLAEKGLHLVCTENGTRIPCQVTTAVRQTNRDVAIAEVECLCTQSIVNGNWLLFESGKVKMGADILEGLNKVSFVPDFSMGAYGFLGRIKFEVEVELVDTVEKPIKLKYA